MSFLERSLARASKCERLPLGDWPTPVRKLERLGRRLGREIWIKRDDRSARPYGGNKVRKLELLLADARQRGARTLLTVGGFGSNHVVATAIYGQRWGFQTQAVVAPQPRSAAAQTNALLAASLGVELIPCQSRATAPLRLLAALRQAQRPYLIGPGGSSPLGTLGYVFAALELKEQLLNHELPEPAAVFVPLGSGGTAAGLALGLALAGLSCPVVAVRVVEQPLCNSVILEQLIWRVRRLLRHLGEQLPGRTNYTIVGDQVGPGYGAVTQQARAAATLLQETEGLTLETTYSAKAMAALTNALRHGPRSSRPVLFWHTANSWSIDRLINADASAALPLPMQSWLAQPR
jgi:D-cysteine desulfhydrase